MKIGTSVADCNAQHHDGFRVDQSRRGTATFGQFQAFPYPFVSSEVETPIGIALNPRGISTSLDANGVSGPSGGNRPKPVAANCLDALPQIGRASCRERVCQYV